MTEYKRPNWVNKAPVQYQEILEKHDMWLKDVEGGERADLSYAHLSYADLRSANLRSADLSSAHLSSANLRYADLSYADLRSANLRSADLSSADLRSADLSSAHLSSANLSYADLRSANLRSANLRVLQTNIWTCYINSETMQIGCENHSIEDWFKFKDSRIKLMNGEALEWWKTWKPILKNIYGTIPPKAEEQPLCQTKDNK